MENKEAFEVVMQSDSKELTIMANIIKDKYEFEITQKPTQGLLMFRVEESVELMDFNAGEILVTTCEAKINKSLGYAMVMGINNEKALNNAIVMSVYESDLPEKNEIENLIMKLKDDQKNKMIEEREIINSTTVRFETMGGQDTGVSHNKIK